MNNTIFYFFYSFAHQSSLLDNVIVFFANYLPYIVILGSILFLFSHYRVFESPISTETLLLRCREVSLVFLSPILAWVVAYLLKILIHVQRPFLALSGVQSLFPETGYSFPSGHATFFSALAISIFFSSSSAKATGGHSKKMGYVLFVCALLIGVARISAGVHFPIDILGGYVLGILVAFLAKTI